MDTSFFKSYYSTLPSTLRNMPIFWSEEELSWLKGSYIIQQIQERKAAIRKDYDVICRVRARLRWSLTRLVGRGSRRHVPSRWTRRSRASRSTASVGHA